VGESESHASERFSAARRHGQREKPWLPLSFLQALLKDLVANFVKWPSRDFLSLSAIKS